MRKNEIDYRSFVEKKKIPIVILDPRWHEMMPQEVKTGAIRGHEKKLNELLKRQGKLVNDIKDLKKLKIKLMEQIVANMEPGSSDEIEKKKEKKQTVSQKMILDINDKIEAYSDELVDIPSQIRETNELLVIECIKYWYPLLEKNQTDIETLDKWILEQRELLKQKLLLKQEKEETSEKLYSYMHKLLGHEVINKFDSSFGPERSDKR